MATDAQQQPQLFHKKNKNLFKHTKSVCSIIISYNKAQGKSTNNGISHNNVVNRKKT